MPISRREFLKTSVAAGAVASMGSLPLHAERASASSLVTLGKSGVKVTRLAFGTGSNNGHVQSALGQKEFSRLVAYAYERGVRFFETSESYTTPAMLGEALKPFPRDSYQLMSKVTTEDEGDPLKKLDELRRTSQTDYFDIMLLHWQRGTNWPDQTASMAGRDSGSAVAPDDPDSRRFGARTAGVAPDARHQVARNRHDPREPQRGRAWITRTTIGTFPAMSPKSSIMSSKPAPREWASLA